MKMLFSHPAGNQNVRAMLDGLESADILAKFATTLAVPAQSAWLDWLPAQVRRDLQRRRFKVPQDKILQHPIRELTRAVCSKIGFEYPLRHEKGFASIDGVLQDFDRFVASKLAIVQHTNAISAVYAYEDSAVHTFGAAKSLGISCAYDLPIAYFEVGRRLMQEEIQRSPAWVNVLGGGTSDSTEKRDRKAKELALADLVVVPSRFVADSLPTWAAHKTQVLSPFGSPASTTVMPGPIDPARPLRVLFVGSMGQRKGLADLFSAMQLLKGENIELVVMGSPLADISFYRGQYADFTHEKGRPHAEVLELMRSCDVFCLPSLFEGRALVMQEAMSQGLPLVITPNTGGEDLIVEGETGFLVPIRAPEQIAEKLAWFNHHRQELLAMKHMAIRHAASYTWQGYAEVVIQAILRL